MIDNEPFDYGIVEIRHRLNINKSINHEKIIIDKCIRMNLVQKNNFKKPTVYWEIQICYKDKNNKDQCAIFRLDYYTISILHKGDFAIDL